MYGFLGGLMGTAPDEFAGSVLDPRSARVRAGAEYGFPVGIAAQFTPAAPLTRGMPVGASTKAVGGMDFLKAQPAAQVSPAGFYSAAEQAALNLQRGKGQGQAFINDLMKAPDVKKEELQATGLIEAFANKPQATKQEVIDYLQANRVNVGETRLDASKTIEREQLKDASHQALQRVDEMIPRLSQLDRANLTTFWAPSAQAGNAEDLAKIRALNLSDAQMSAVMDYGAAVNRQRDFIESANGYMAQPKFGQYTLPGGENYREVLLTLPEQPVNSYDSFVKQLNRKYGEGFDTDAITQAERSQLTDLWNQSQSGVKSSQNMTYRSSHWEQPNVLAHIRMNDRIDADGKKLSLIEEIQSDWHQAGREKGYGPKMEKSVEAYYETKAGQRIPIGFGKTKEEAEASIDVGWKNMVDIKYDTIERKVGEGVPDAPMKETWYQTALRKAVKDAIDQGSDRVGITTGARQAERYDLSKQIESVTAQKWSNGGFKISAVGKNGDQLVDQFAKTQSDLEGIVGKELAQKIVDTTSGDKRTASFSGLDLQVGGEGMKKYYDEIYPKYLDKFAKKYGASVKEGALDLPAKDSWPNFRDWAERNNVPSMNALSEWERGSSSSLVRRFLKDAKQTETIRYIDITPQMREAFGGKGKGVPLFSAAPAVPLSFSDLFNPQPAQQSQPTQQSQPSTITKFSDLFLTK